MGELFFSPPSSLTCDSDLAVVIGLGALLDLFLYEVSGYVGRRMYTLYIYLRPRMCCNWVSI